MFRFIRRWFLRAAALGFLLYVAFAGGSLSYLIGYALLGWVLFRAAPGCYADVQTARAFLAPWSQRRSRLTSANSTF